jgi:trigger factor
MEYQLEDVSPVQKKVNVTVPAEEVNAALNTTVALFKKDLKISGFRQGKAPAELVESRFQKEVYEQTQKDLLNVHFNQIFSELGVEPTAGLNVDDQTSMKRDQDYHYSIEFEVRPQIELPEYHGLQVQERQTEVTQEQVDSMIHQLQRASSSLKVVEDGRAPQDGDVAVVDFTVYENGEPLENFQAKGFELPLGQGQALEDFETIVKELHPGEKAKKPVTFPEDFINEQLAGKTLDMEVQLNVVKEYQLPEVDEDLAAKVGAGSVQEMRDKLAENMGKYQENMERSRSQQELLDQLASRMELTLPPSMLESQLNYLLQKKQEQMESQGKSLESLGSMEELREQFLPTAEDQVKKQLILLEIAQKEELTVSDQEVERQLQRMAQENGQDPQQLKEYYEKNNLMYALRDSLLADKAMDRLYQYAQVEKVESLQEDEENAEEGGSQSESASEPEQE